MAIRALASDCTALILAFASFTLAFLLLVDLGSMALPEASSSVSDCFVPCCLCPS
jgi:hypothetical protein